MLRVALQLTGNNQGDFLVTNHTGGVLPDGHGVQQAGQAMITHLWGSARRARCSAGGAGDNNTPVGFCPTGTVYSRRGRRRPAVRRSARVRLNRLGTMPAASMRRGTATDP